MLSGLPVCRYQRNSLNLTYYKGRVKNENSFFTRPFYLAGNNLFIEKVEVVVTMAGFVIIRYPERKGWTHVRESSLYSAKDEAEASIKK